MSEFPSAERNFPACGNSATRHARRQQRTEHTERTAPRSAPRRHDIRRAAPRRHHLFPIFQKKGIKRHGPERGGGGAQVSVTNPDRLFDPTLSLGPLHECGPTPAVQ